MRPSGDVVMNVAARELLGTGFLESITTEDLYKPLRRVVRGGWVLDGDAVVLVEFRRSYFGNRSKFPNTGSYESAVNGRGIPDSDLAESGILRVPSLMRRGVAFAWEALHVANSAGFEVVARVSAAPVITEPEAYTGYVTFCSSKNAREAGIGCGIDQSGMFQIILSSEACSTPLPRNT